MNRNPPPEPRRLLLLQACLHSWINLLPAIHTNTISSILFLWQTGIDYHRNQLSCINASIYTDDEGPHEPNCPGYHSAARNRFILIYLHDTCNHKSPKIWGQKDITNSDYTAKPLNLPLTPLYCFKATASRLHVCIHMHKKGNEKDERDTKRVFTSRLCVCVSVCVASWVSVCVWECYWEIFLILCANASHIPQQEMVEGKISNATII